MRLATVVASLLIACALHAQTASEDLRALQDNSFLVEEAYNQEAGFLQHIGVFIRDTEHDEWDFRFSSESPLRSRMQQVSLTVPVHGNGETELGDVVLSYRYQLLGDRTRNWAVAPRASIILATGKEELGDNKSALVFNLPISHVFSPRVIGHTNIGARFDTEEDLLKADVTAGQSLIYAFNNRVHLMLEAVFAEEEDHSEIFISPGVRFGWRNPSGLQIVAGVGVPIGVGGSSGEESVLVYLSVAHPFSRVAAR